MGTVAKALSLLNLFRPNRQEIGLSDLARLSGMNKATVHRLMGEMQSQGLVEQTGPERAYRIGAGVLRLSALREASVPLLDVSREVLADLSARTTETTHVSVVQGTRLNALTHVCSRTHATSVTMNNVDELAFHATASGLAVLAFAAPDFVAGRLSEPLVRYTDSTITDRRKIETALDDIRKTGVAESVGGFEKEVHSHAAPVFGPDQRPIGAIAVATPSARMTPKSTAAFRQHVRDASCLLTGRIGGLFPDAFPVEATNDPPSPI